MAFDLDPIATESAIVEDRTAVIAVQLTVGLGESHRAIVVGTDERCIKSYAVPTIGLNEPPPSISVATKDIDLPSR